MSIVKTLLPDEQIINRTKKHLIIFFFPVVLTLLSIYIAGYMSNNPILEKLQWAPWVVTLIFWAYAYLEYLTSEFVVTNKRVLMREGFFVRHSNETRLAAISQVTVNQSLIGQLFNYGTVLINAFGASDSFAMIARPNVFQQCVNEAIDKATTDKTK
ncbi:MAG TPA: PH domain-containing protein [Gammaproteobacteria bacterium]|jgi:uncharacterized membrane protein YdbT with pleckstrin-like domain|nr:PH domain-containing protein [Gammaproteobacteria bacterium]